jgi:hypothetical protein
MEESFNPLDQLKTLLGPKPNHPWGALIPQVLLWCFRRFCIEKLTEEYDTPLTEQVWDDHLELIHLHAPRGLESATGSWMTPENIDHVHSSLEEYNRYFLEFLIAIDNAMANNDSEMENMISGFLDIDIKNVILEWLGEDEEFLIFPLKDEDEDEFTDEQFTRLLGALMNSQPAEPPAEEPPVEEPPAEEPPAAEEPEVKTIAEAISRRRTLRASKPIRGKTRRIHTVV